MWKATSPQMPLNILAFTCCLLFFLAIIKMSLQTLEIYLKWEDCFKGLGYSYIISTYLVNKYGEHNTKTEFSGRQVAIQ